ncbi:MAG: PIN domain-containing protein [Propionibacteriaceae bacterium]|nr:PIN domain-containing protein [Propionibacteriaceae bacterium]
MILVDTSVWIDHFQVANVELIRFLKNDEVCCHPLVITEIASGSIARRSEILKLLQQLRQLPQADNNEVLVLIETNKLWGKGLSAVDINILASAKITLGTKIWTRDKALSRAAEDLAVNYRFA